MNKKRIRKIIAGIFAFSLVFGNLQTANIQAAGRVTPITSNNGDSPIGNPITTDDKIFKPNLDEENQELETKIIYEFVDGKDRPIAGLEKLVIKAPESMTSGKQFNYKLEEKDIPKGYKFKGKLANRPEDKVQYGGSLEVRISIEKNLFVNVRFVEMTEGGDEIQVGKIYKASITSNIDNGSFEENDKGEIVYILSDQLIPKEYKLDPKYKGKVSMVLSPDKENDLKVVLVKSRYIGQRLAGSDRYMTAIEVSKKFYSHGADTVILVRADEYADALSSSLLAKIRKAPILLTQKDQLNKEVGQEIKRLGAKEVIIVGGYSAVSKSIEDEISGFTVENEKVKVNRISGSNRFETSALVAFHMDKNEVVNLGGRAFIASGEDWPDALTSAVFATKLNHPILLVSKYDVNTYVSAIIKKANIKEATIIGGEARISEAVVEKLKESNVPIITRIFGLNRFDTASKIAQEGFSKNDKVYVASGHSFADALIMVPIAAIQDVPILLTSEAGLSMETRTYITSKNINEINIIGGTARVSEKIAEQLIK